MRVYGTADPDSTAYDFLLKLVEHEDVESILLHQRIPIDARACKLPQSLTIQAVLKDKTVITVRQNQPGSRAFRT